MEEEKDVKSTHVRLVAETVIVFVAANAFWWFMFARPFLKLFERLVAGIDRISPP